MAFFTLGLFVDSISYNATSAAGAAAALNGRPTEEQDRVFLWDVANLRGGSVHGRAKFLASRSWRSGMSDSVLRLPHGSWDEDVSIVGEMIAVDEVVRVVKCAWEKDRICEGNI
ncbi:hypothetical protein BU23DRAFT_572813 [Bimuria novae-zelandiae CBS 107.79]|uniref:Uncharacterized protein n=1 Tax=Bimuria novae-zelandiae CBS 107.79 TaxID=1447943 RepID=A0A6A5UY82_9PLEO|nr:hypothetical protein BU23DRAFT_572813 [Bimuria novae-zelandiae CBS 107.79]